jgi:hypothetical protein
LAVLLSARQTPFACRKFPRIDATCLTPNAADNQCRHWIRTPDSQPAMT